MPFLKLSIAYLLISTCSAATAASTTLVHLPNTVITVAKVDAAGNIYVAGSQGDPATPDSNDAFVAKLSPDGSKVIYSTTIGGSKSDGVAALDIDAKGAAYIFGQTLSPDFPTTPGAFQGSPLGSSMQGFVAKFDAQGKVVYATLIGGTSTTSPIPGGFLVDAAGEAYISGFTNGGTFTPPSVSVTNAGGAPNFVLKLDSNGAQALAAVRGVGGRLALDDQGSIYIAGSGGQAAIPLTPGAFQSTFTFHPCGGTGQLAFGCPYQYVTKLDANLTKIVYSTFLAGSYGAVPAAIFVDAQRNAVLVGTTNSPDYPTTSDGFEPIYAANAPPGPQINIFGTIYPPPSTGFVTKLNPTGTGLVYSTFFSGTQTDTIQFAALTSGGIYLSGQAGSADLPALEGVPMQCLPQTFETRLSLDGQTVTATRLVSGNVLAFEPATGTLLSWTGSDLIRFDPAAPPTAIACIVDAADLRPVTAVAPGELLSIFGSHFIDVSEAPSSFPTSISGLKVAVNGTASPLLYVSPQQINLQAPYEIAGAAQASVVLTSLQTNLSDSRILPVVARNPVAFLDTVTPLASVSFGNCTVSGIVYSGGPLPVAFNSDGSRNGCKNPAASGTPVKIFLAGLGVTAPAPVTGSINSNPAVPLNVPVILSRASLGTIVSATSVPGSISGTTEVTVLIAPNNTGAVPFSPLVDSVPVRDTNLTIWIK
jgi:uncharacterized protein (TIGR03437 family)